VRVTLERHTDVDTGTFRVRSAVTEGTPDPLPEVPSRGAPRVRLVTGAGAPKQIDLTGDVLVIGRGSTAGLRLDDTGVSRQHAELRREGDDVVLVDLGSTNGSSVNGRHVERARLAPGDRIELGRCVLVYERDDR
jgi:pSer/pThr/pTyr-binding forkhead associated (FHA) protein